MEYTLTELAAELNTEPRTLRRLIPDAPHREYNGMVWTIGTQFAEWYRSREQQTQPLGEGQAYCLKCRCPVMIRDPQPATLQNGTPVLRGSCPACGSDVIRFLPQC